MHLALWCQHMFCFNNKTKICTTFGHHSVRRHVVWQMFPSVYFFARLHISVLFDKTKIGKLRTDGGVICHKYFGPKTHFFWINTLCDHYALVFTWSLHKLILLFFDSNLHKSQKIPENRTSSMSKIEIDETLLGNSTRR